MIPASADASARPMSISLAIAPNVESVPSLPGPFHSSTPRKVRSDKGILKGPYKPRQPTRGTLKGDHLEISLSGVHGLGNSLGIAKEDHQDLMRMSDEGKRIYVVTNRSEQPTVVMTTKAPPTPGSHQTVTVARFIAGEMHGGRKLRYKDGNPFNLHRDNLETEVKATGERFPIDWNKSVAGRSAFLSLVQPHNEGSAVQH